MSADEASNSVSRPPSLIVWTVTVKHAVGQLAGPASSSGPSEKRPLQPGDHTAFLNSAVGVRGIISLRWPSSEIAALRSSFAALVTSTVDAEISSFHRVFGVSCAARQRDQLSRPSSENTIESSNRGISIRPQDTVQRAIETRSAGEPQEHAHNETP